MKSAEDRPGLGEGGRLALMVLTLALVGGPGCSPSPSAPEPDAGREIAAADADQIPAAVADRLEQIAEERDRRHGPLPAPSLAPDLGASEPPYHGVPARSLP